MEFCDKCGAMIQPKIIEGKVVIVCPTCGPLEKKVKKEDKILTEEITQKKDEQMVVIENPDEINTMPTKKMECPKCKKVQDTQYWTLQTRSGDEAPTQFYRCTKCKHTWREYD